MSAENRSKVDDGEEKSELQTYAAKSEEWQAARETWERFSGMDQVYQEIERQINECCMTQSTALVLTQGVDESMNRFKELYLNFAVTAALFLAGEGALLISPVEGVLPGSRTVDTYWIWIYFCTGYLAFALHCGVVIMSVHLSFHMEQFQRDADFLQFCLDHDLSCIKDTLLIKPLLIGVTVSFVPILITIVAHLKSANIWILLFLAGLPTILAVAGPPYLSRHASVAVLSSYNEKGSQPQNLKGPLLKIYRDMANFDRDQARAHQSRDNPHGTSSAHQQKSDDENNLVEVKVVRRTQNNGPSAQRKPTCSLQ